MAGSTNLLGGQPAGIGARVTFRRDFVVGGIDDPSVQLTLVFPQHVLVDGRGGFAVLNAQEAYVAQFDGNGRLVRKLGRKGGGPGELQFPLAVSSDSLGQVWVFDVTKRALVGYGPSGAALPEVSARGRGLLQRFAWLPDGAVLLERTRADTTVLLRVHGPDTAVVARMVGETARPVDRTACGLRGETRRPVFSADFSWAARNDVIAYIADGEFGVTIVRGNGPPRRLQRQATPPPATADLARRALGGGDSVFINDRGWCTTPVSVILAGAGVAARVPAYQRVLIDASSRVWAIRYPLPGANPEADIFDIERGYVGTVALGPRRPVAFLSDGRMISLERDPSDVPLLTVYALAWSR